MKNNKKHIKRLKKQIIAHTAINIGYHNSVINQIPQYALFEAIRVGKNYLNDNSDDAELRNIIVTESVKAMNYQDFKQISNYFFN